MSLLPPPELWPTGYKLEPSLVQLATDFLADRHPKHPQQTCAVDEAALVYGQMNEPPGARARVALTGLTVAEYFRDEEGQERWAGAVPGIVHRPALLFWIRIEYVSRNDLPVHYESLPKSAGRRFSKKLTHAHIAMNSQNEASNGDET